MNKDKNGKSTDLASAESKIKSLMKKESTDAITIERQYLPEIFSADLLEISKHNGLPDLKPFVISYLKSKGISFENIGNNIRFKKMYKFKVIIIGPRSVDKTILIHRIVEDRFTPNYKLTVGVDILTKDVEFRSGKIATLSIWDIGDQQRFDFIHSTFYKGAAGALLVFDLIRAQTYTEIRKRLTEIRQFAGENIPFVLIGVKFDICDSTDLTLRNEARDFTRNEGGIFIEITPDNIDFLEKAISELICVMVENYRVLENKINW